MVLPSVSCLFMWPPATEAYTPSAVLTKVPEMNLIGSLLSHALWPKASDTLKSRSWAAGRTWEPGLESEPQDPRTWEKGERTFAQRTGEQVLHRQTQQLCLKHYLLPVFFKGGEYNNTIKECSGNTLPPCHLQLFLLHWLITFRYWYSCPHTYIFRSSSILLSAGKTLRDNS